MADDLILPTWALAGATAVLAAATVALAYFTWALRAETKRLAEGGERAEKAAAERFERSGPVPIVDHANVVHFRKDEDGKGLWVGEASFSIRNEGRQDCPIIACSIEYERPNQSLRAYSLDVSKPTLPIDVGAHKLSARLTGTFIAFDDEVKEIAARRFMTIRVYSGGGLAARPSEIQVVPLDG